MTRIRRNADASRQQLHDEVFYHLLRTLTPPSGCTYQEMNEYATALIIQMMPDIQARFSPRWKPEPKTIRRMARRLVGKWLNASPHQDDPGQHRGSLQHDALLKHETSTQHNDSVQRDASISDANQQHVSVQLASPALQVTTMPIRSKQRL